MWRNTERLDVIAPRWRPELQPTSPQGAIVFGAQRSVLARRLLLVADEVSAVKLWVGQAAIVVLGPAELLPWIDGIQYLSARSEAPQLLLPSTQRPDLPLDLVYQALTLSGLAGRLLLWPEPRCCIELDLALPWTSGGQQAVKSLADAGLPQRGLA